MKRIIVLLVSAVMLMSQPALSATGKILKIDFKTPVVERESDGFSLSSFSLSSIGNGSITLYELVRAIYKAAEDESVSMIYMTPSNLSAGMSHAEEIRAALESFRSSGKEIVAYCDNLSNVSYYLASVANKVILNPASENYLMGLGSQQYFLKDALDALGVEVQLIRHGKYKSAGEMFTRNDFSPENYEQYRVMITSLWNGMCDEIASSRNFTSDQFKGWIDDLSLVNPAAFKEKGLVDELWYIDQVEDYFCEKEGKTPIKLVGFVPLKRYLAKVAKAQRKINRKNKKSAVAVIYANGEIVTSSSGINTSSDVIIGKKLASVIAKVRKDDNIKAVVFRVNSPGGSVTASELIKREIDLLKASKPVVASYGDYAASGGYWISAGCNRIFCDKTTLTGSIGCFSMVPNLGDAIRKKLRVNFGVVSSSKHSDMMSGMRHLDESETAFLQTQIEEIYDNFTTIVSEGRSMDKDRVDEIGQGRVWAGTDALGIGLVDEIGDLYQAIKCAAETAELSDYALVEYPEVTPFSFMSLFSQPQDLDETVTSDSESAVSIMLDTKFPFVSAMFESKSPVMMARLPYTISFN
ncbi:MAG: signal peptide peptidase SppA [Bacteroidaceae bacterium]|nr:signal peptide peptidase SppA [Bacteroidaceae bacterium]